MRSGKSAVQSTVLRCAYNPWLGRVSAPSPGPRPRPRPRTNCSINLLTMARWHRPVTSQPGSSNNLFINKHKTPPPRQKKLCRINSSNILVTSSINIYIGCVDMDGHWTCTDPMSRVPLYTIPVHRVIELQTNPREGYAKFYNHGEGPYLPCLAQCLKCENASMHFQPGEDPSSRGLLCDEIFT